MHQRRTREPQQEASTAKKKKDCACPNYPISSSAWIPTIIQLVLIIHGFHIGSFTHWLTFICNHQNQCSQSQHGFSQTHTQKHWVIRCSALQLRPPSCSPLTRACGARGGRSGAGQEVKLWGQLGRARIHSAPVNGAASGKSLSTAEPRYLFCKKKKIQSTRIDNIFLKFKIIIYMGYACASVYFPKNNYLLLKY